MENTSAIQRNGISTGFNELDQLTTGLQKGDLIIIGGRPAMGKTSFGLSIAIRATVQGKHPTVIFSLEMSKQQITQRLLCTETRVNIQLLPSGKLPKNGYRIPYTESPLFSAPLFVDDTPAITVLELLAKARQIQNLELVIIDYLQLMGKVGSQQQEIQELKGVARELNIPLIVLSQLSRAPEHRSDHRPQPSDLPDAIEQNADVILFIYRERVHHKALNKQDKSNAEIIVSKQRNGMVGTVKINIPF